VTCCALVASMPLPGVGEHLLVPTDGGWIAPSPEELRWGFGTGPNSDGPSSVSSQHCDSST
jgi:hypothetical protein